MTSRCEGRARVLANPNHLPCSGSGREARGTSAPALTSAVVKDVPSGAARGGALVCPSRTAIIAATSKNTWDLASLPLYGNQDLFYQKRRSGATQVGPGEALAAKAWKGHARPSTVGRVGPGLAPGPVAMLGKEPEDAQATSAKEPL